MFLCIYNYVLVAADAFVCIIKVSSRSLGLVQKFMASFALDDLSGNPIRKCKTMGNSTGV
jgi:hypothetical protein